MFLGAWRVWSHYAWRSARTLPVIRTVAFLQQWTKAEAPPRTRNEVLWEDHVGANRWYTEKFLSVSSILRFHDESDADDSGHGVVPESGSRPRRSGRSALPATTFSGYPWPSSSTVQRGIEVPPPLGNRSVTSSDYQSHSPDWLQTLRERLLRGYDHPVLRKKKSSKPVLTYLERQSTTRRLTNESHAGVVEGLERLAADGLVEFTVETFGTPAGKAMPFEEQIAIISRTDVRELPLHPLGSCSLC